MQTFWREMKEMMTAPEGTEVPGAERVEDSKDLANAVTDVHPITAHVWCGEQMAVSAMAMRTTEWKRPQNSTLASCFRNTAATGPAWSVCDESCISALASEAIEYDGRAHAQAWHTETQCSCGSRSP